MSAPDSPEVLRPFAWTSQRASCRLGRGRLAIPADDLTCPGALVSFLDVRDGYRRKLPYTLWARCYHKKRAFVFGDVVVPGHLFFSTDPIVRASNSTLAFHARVRDTVGDLLADVPRWDRRLGLSRRLQRLVPLTGAARRSVDLELAFTRGAPARPGLMRRAVRTLGLEFAAVDYSVLADGRVVLWEANPYPWLTRSSDGILPGRRQLRKRNHRIFSALGRFFEGLL